MKLITFNRAAIAFALIYFPVATLGATGSYFDAMQEFVRLVAILVIGAIEYADVIARRRSSSNDEVMGETINQTTKGH